MTRIHSRFLIPPRILAALALPALAGSAIAAAPAAEDAQAPLPAARKIVPAPALSAEEELHTFRLPPGFKIELVADESVVRDPVAAAFDLEGNLWIAEMTRFNSGMIEDMPELATGATSVPASSIVKLTSSKNDGRFDQRTVFMGDLNAPRTLVVVRDGLIFSDSPNLWLARDTDGDGKYDEKALLTDDYGIDLINESNANGLLWGRDNILHNICFGFDYHYRAGKLTGRLATPIRGEFGLTQDDYGRLFFNRNSDQLRTDLYPVDYVNRNPHVLDLPWINVRIPLSQEIWPGHPTPVVNRGYRKGELGETNGGIRDDGTLMEFSAACSPLIYRGGNFPTGFYNNAFVPEPAANLIKRDLLLEAEGRITAVNAYDGHEFLTSTDTRFRPVALLNAPDGSMIIVDLYRGILEEYHLITKYLLQQSLARGLDKPMFGLGRIWRVTYEGGPLEHRRPDLKTRSAVELVPLLAHPNAWWRDSAQQELIERGDTSAVPALAALAHEAESDVTRIYALWTLDGLGANTPGLLQPALSDPSAKVRRAAIRMHEHWLAGPEADATVRRLSSLLRDPAREVSVQLALTLGYARTPAGLDTLHRLFLIAGDHPYMPKAIATGLKGRELDFMRLLTSDLDSTGARPETKSLLTILSSALVHEGDPEKISRLLTLAGDGDALPDWARLALLDGFTPLAQPAFRRSITAGRVLKASALAPLLTAKDDSVRETANSLCRKLGRIEEQEKARTVAARPLTESEVLLAEQGKVTFQICAGCHQATGTGLPNVAPSLVESHWVTGQPETLARIVLNGKEGTPGFPGAMPPLGGTFTDEQIAGVLTYIRNSWGLQAGAVSPETVAKIREQVGSRQAAWTDSELRQLEKELIKASQSGPIMTH